MADWVGALVKRFTDQLADTVHTEDSLRILEQTKHCLVSVSKHKFMDVITGLTETWKSVELWNESAADQNLPMVEKNHRMSIILILQTLEQCLLNATTAIRQENEANVVNLLLNHLQVVLNQPDYDSEIRGWTECVLRALSHGHFNCLFLKVSRRLQSISCSGEDVPDTSDINLLQHMAIDLHRLKKIMSLACQFRNPRKALIYSLAVNLEKIIWNWIDHYPDEFAALQSNPDMDLHDCCDKLFEINSTFAESPKKKAAVWPLLVVLLAIAPKFLEEITNAETGAPCSPQHKGKKQFVDDLRKAVNPSNYKPTLSEGAVIACVRMCKASTYIKSADSSNVLITLVKSIVLDLKAGLFSPGIRLFKGASPKEDADLMIDCFVSFYRITPHSNDVLKFCLNQNSPIHYHYILVAGLLQIIRQDKISWWPDINIIYSRGSDLRKMFKNTMTAVQKANTGRGQPPALMYKVSLKNKEHRDESITPNQLLYQIVQLINAAPLLMLNSPQDSNSAERHQAASDLINNLVTLVIQQSDLLAHEAMEALLRIHQPDVIELWNKNTEKDVTIQTFWDISSRVLYIVSQKLINHQLINYTDILKWLREILACRNKFLSRNKDSANVGSSNKVCTQAHIKLEVVLFLYLWSIEIEAVLTAMSCFEFMCEEADILYSGDEQVVNLNLPNYSVYQEIAKGYRDPTTGRAALQKRRILPMLRKVEEPTDGNKQAWTTTYLINWTKATDFLSNYPKTDPQNMTMKKRTPYQTPDHELEDQLHEWANMTGFLCALGSVCLTKLGDRSGISISDTNQYCAEFIGRLLKLLVCNNEKFGPQIQKHVKECVANELNQAIYPILFEQIKLDVDKFFEAQNGQAIVKEINTLYIENIIFIIKTIMETEQGGEHLGQTAIEPLMLAIVRYVRYLSDDHHDITIKTKLCTLAEVMMDRRDDLTFKQEMKFRNKLVEYLTEWIMGNTSLHGGSKMKLDQRQVPQTRHLDLACMRAVAALLKALPLQPEESDRGDLMEAKSSLFQRYFTLFMKLLNDCSEELECGKEKHQGVGGLTELRTVTVQAMSNLLNANIDSGLMHSITLGYHKDAQTRAAFMEVLTNILRQGTEFETLAETALADRYDRLVELVTMIGDKGELPIAMALANVVDNQHLDELARVLVTIFDAKHLLYQLLGNMFSREVESDCIQTLFRGNDLSSKIMSFCFKLYGSQYLRSLFAPHIEKMFDDDLRGVYYEVDMRRLEGTPAEVQTKLEENRKNLMILTQNVFNAIVESAESFPSRLKNMLHYLCQVVENRYPDESSVFAVVGTVVFLRFINPALVSAHEFGLCSNEPTINMKRGLTLVCKIMQNIANRMEAKEMYMKHFNNFLRTNFDNGQALLRKIAMEEDDDDSANQINYFSDSTSVALHRLLWTYQEKIGEFLASSRDQKAAGRRPYDKMATLLAHVGPPEHRPATSDRWSSMFMGMSSTKFEELMSRQNMHEKDEFKNLKSLMIFYQSGVSKNGYPVFYFVARRYKWTEINGDLLIYHVLLTLKPYYYKPFDLVIDFTHTTYENRFRSNFLNKWFYVMPDAAYKNLHQVLIYNCCTWVKDFTKYHDRQFCSLKNNSKLVFIDHRSQFPQYIEPDQLKLPGSTLSLEEDLRVWSGGLKLIHRDTRCSIKIGQNAIHITSNDKSKVLGVYVLLNDVYYVSEIKEVSLIDDNQFTITISESGTIPFYHQDSEMIVLHLNNMKHRYQLTQPDSYTPHTKIQPKDVPGTLLNVALLNLGSPDPSLRLAAYNLLYVLTKTFDLQIEGQLLESSGLCIPSNNTLFIKHISEKLAANVTRLTLEFLEECIQGCRHSNIEMKHLCLEYMTPWLPNLTKFCKHQDDAKRQKVMLILDKLITLTIEEVEMYPSVQAKIWGNIGQVGDLIDMVLDSFIKRSVTGGFGSKPADIMADTSVALASANFELVSRKVVSRILQMIEKTCVSPTPTLESHLMWNDIAILARYLLMLSFNNSLDVATHLPFLFHIVTLLVGLGPVSMKASTHGLVINIIHSLCTCSQLNFNEDTEAAKQLKLNLAEFSLPKFYNLFGISKVKSAAVSAFRSSYRPNDRSFVSISPDDESVPLTSLEVITDALLEIMESCTARKRNKGWIQQWMNLEKRFAFMYNPALQPRAIVVYGCICKTISETEIKQLLRILRKALESERVLIEGVIMCLTRVQPLLKPDSVIHKFLFWVAVSILQLEEQRLYSAGLTMLENNLLTLENDHGVFDKKSLSKVMMATRQQLEWHFKQIDHNMDISFDSNFHFALVSHLLKGFRHPDALAVSRTIRVLNLCLSIVSKNLPDKYTVTAETLPYLVALMPVSEEVRTRCPLSPPIPPAPYDVFASPSLVKRNRSRGTTGYQMSGYTASSAFVDSNKRLTGMRKHWRSLDESGNHHPIVSGRSTSCNVGSTAMSSKLASPAFRKGYTRSLDIIYDDDEDRNEPPPVSRAQRTSRTERNSHTSTSNENHILLDQDILDEPLQALVLTVLATLVGFSSDEQEKRVIYQYLAEACEKFPHSFPVVYNQLDSIVHMHLKFSHDQELLSALHTIIQSMLTIDPEQCQTQLSKLHDMGFGGISRFAGPFKIKNRPEKKHGKDDHAITLCDLRSYNGLESIAWTGDQVSSGFSGSENLANCLEDMVETCLPGDDKEFEIVNPYPTSLGITASLSLSSLGGSPNGADSVYRSRHMSHQQRRGSFNRKTRKHSDSLE